MLQWIIISLLALATKADTVSITANPTSDILPWKTTLTLTCTFTADLNGEFLVDGKSLDNEECYYYGKTEKVKVTRSAGEVVLTLEDVRSTDSGRTFGCVVLSIGSAKYPYLLTVQEPPLSNPTSVSVEPSYTYAIVTFEAVDNATIYRVGYRTYTETAWEERETENTELRLDNLVVATNYYIRVEAGNEVKYRPEIEPTEATFMTLDNRAPKPVTDLSAATVDDKNVLLTWTLDDNTDGNFVVTKITVSGKIKDGEDLGAAEDLAANAISYTFSDLAPGEYEFTVKTANEVSGDDDSVAVIAYTVEEVVVPEEPEEPEPVVLGLLCLNPNAGYDTDNNVEPDTADIREAIPGSNLSLACYLSPNSSYTTANITWATSKLDQSALTAEDDIAIIADETSSSITITTINENHMGLYTCKVSTETCTFKVEITGVEMGTTGNGTSGTSPTCFILLLIAFLYHVVN